MITVLAKLKIRPDGREAFEAAAAEMIEHVKANEPQTLQYVLLRSQGDANEFVFYEVYSDQAALDAHGTSAQMQKFFGAVGALLAGQPEIKTYEEISGKK